jgi:hypothetical protein
MKLNDLVLRCYAEQENEVLFNEVMPLTSEYPPITCKELKLGVLNHVSSH